MKRSDINAALQAARGLLGAYGWSLPGWADWTTADFIRHPKDAAYLRARQMGWDVTDFGLGDFSRIGLTLFCIRNGLANRAGEIPYAEKLLFIQDGQLTPTHRHAMKTEDIINRAGGDLVIEFSLGDRAGAAIDGEVVVRTDGIVRKRSQWQPLVLKPGESVTIPTGLYHRFYGRPGSGPVLVGEVSMVNDDRTDNYFLEPLGRFTEIVEDEAPLYPLWNEGADG